MARLEQHVNAKSSMRVTPGGITMLVRPVQERKALFPMLVTPLEIVTLTNRLQEKKALSPMRVTGRELMVPGMITAPPSPV